MDVRIASPLVSGALTTQVQAVADNSTSHRLTFNPPIKGATIKVRSTSGATEDVDEGVLLVFSNQSEIVTDAWLDEANIGPRVQVDKNDGQVPVSFNGGEVSYVDIIGVGASPALTVTVGGVS